MIEPAYYKGQEMVCLFAFPNDLGPALGEVLTVEAFEYVPQVKTIMLHFEGYLPMYGAKFFINRKEFNRQMLELPKGHIPQQLVPLPKEYKLN